MLKVEQTVDEGCVHLGLFHSLNGNVLISIDVAIKIRLSCFYFVFVSYYLP